MMMAMVHLRQDVTLRMEQSVQLVMRGRSHARSLSVVVAVLLSNVITSMASTQTALIARPLFVNQCESKSLEVKKTT